MLVADDSRLGALVVLDERALHLRGTDAVSGDVDDVVDAAGDPEVPILVAARAVTGEVESWVRREVRLLESLVVARHGSHHARPCALDAQHTLARTGGKLLARLAVDECRHDAEEGTRSASRLLRKGTGKRRDHVSARLRLPPRVDDRAFLLAHHLVVPLPSLRVDGLANRSEQAQGGQVARVDDVVAEADQASDERGRGVKHRHAVLVDNIPAAACVGVRGNALEDDALRLGDERPVREVRVPRDPSRVGGAPEHVVRLVVEDVLERRVRAHHVPAGGVQHTLGCSRGTGRVEAEQRVLAVHPLDGTVFRLRVHDVRPVGVNAFVPVALREGQCGVIVHDDAFDVHALVLAELDARVHHLLDGDGLGASHGTRGCENHLWFGVDEPAGERVGGEACEDDGVHGANARTREHRDDKVRHHGKVDGDVVPLSDADAPEVVGELADALFELRPRHDFVLVRFVSLPQQSRSLGVGRRVPVDGVVAEVRLSSREPRYADGSLAHVEVEGVHGLALVVRRVPVQFVSDFPPELRRSVDAFAVHVVVLLERANVRVVNERRGWVDGSVECGVFHGSVVHGRLSCG
mmetsp:Transcript_11143/g.25229  ORF Transcript_11143/g.25229 Transcript_11143/m.25229 type:complete len:580 (+) Transcript_11143:1307-3046(+)